MQILVLGSAAGGGFPQWNSNAPACWRARRGDVAAKPRTQASVAVSADGERWFLLNATPDMRTQIDANPALWPREGLRSSPIAGVVVTGGDVDAVAGLLTLRERHAFTLFATREVHRVLAENSIFRVLAPDCVERQTLRLEAPTPLVGPEGGAARLQVTAFAVPGKVALWLEEPGREPGISEDGRTVGLEIAEPATGARFYFVPGCAAMTPALTQRLAGAPLVFFDGTLWRDDEMILAGVGQKTGRRMGHVSMSGEEGSLARLAGLGIGRRIFVHVNNSNPALLADSAERAAVAAAGWEVAEDGMEIAP